MGTKLHIIFINIQVFHIRFGKVIMRSGEVFELYDTVDEVLASYILQFYNISSNILPNEIDYQKTLIYLEPIFNLSV